MPGAQTVALLALAYQTVGRHPDPDPLGCLEDVEVAPGELSLLYLMSTAHLGELDWMLLRIRAWRPRALPELVAQLVTFDPLRAEALVHAWPGDAPSLPEGERSHPGRWQAVEDEMGRLRAEGLTLTHDEQDAIAEAAFAAASGQDVPARLE